MMKGYMKGMKITQGNPCRYDLKIGLHKLHLNDCIGKQLTMRFSGDIRCVACGTQMSKSYNQGFCYRCFSVLARNDQCVMSPNLCHFAKGTCREPAWGMLNCMQRHLVYVAWTSGFKVGITKPANMPTRWYDQGALIAQPVCYVRTRHHAGLIETYLKQWFNDKTQWRQMLSAYSSNHADLHEVVKEAQTKVKDSPEMMALGGIEFVEEGTLELAYPMPDELPKIQSLSFDKTKEITSVLTGMKGQYLYLDSGVINMRKFIGYELSVDVD